MLFSMQIKLRSTEIDMEMRPTNHSKDIIIVGFLGNTWIINGTIH